MSVTGHLSEKSALPAPGDTATAGDRAHIKLAAKFRQENKGEILRNCTNFIGKFREIRKKISRYFAFEIFRDHPS